MRIMWLGCKGMEVPQFVYRWIFWCALGSKQISNADSKRKNIFWGKKGPCYSWRTWQADWSCDCMRSEWGAIFTYVRSVKLDRLISTIPPLAMVAVFSSSPKFPPGLAIILGFFFLIIPLFPPQFQVMPQCVKECNRTFASEGALSRHRKNCSVLALVRQRSSEVWRDKGIRESVQTILLSRKQRLQVSACSAIYYPLLTHCCRYRHILHVLYLLRDQLLL